MNKERGVGLIGWLAVLALIGFVGLITVRVVPVYMEGWTVRSIVYRLAEDPSVRDVSRAELRQSIMRRFQLNSVDRIDREHVSLKTVAEGVQVIVEYEVRTPLIGNFDGIASFRFDTVIPN